MADPYTSTRNLLPSHGRPPQSHARHQNLRQTPWLVIFCIVVLLASMVVSIAIIALSNDQPVKRWKIQPAVLLSVMSSIFTLTLEALVAIGLAICWWRSAAHGTTLKRLHYIWNGMNVLNFVPAVIAGVDTRKVALTAAAIALAKFANGPLLQRATHTRNPEIAVDVQMKIHLAQQIPDGHFGPRDDGPFGASVFLDQNSLASLQEWYFNTTLTTFNDAGFYCQGNGTCRARVTGAGLNYSCVSTSETLDMLDPKNNQSTIFNITLYMNYDHGQPMLFLEVVYLSEADDSCIGTIVTETCNIIAATIEYPIIIQNTTLSLDYNNLFVNRTVVSNYTSPGDLLSAPAYTLAGPLTSLESIASQFFDTYALMNFPPISYSSSTTLVDLWFDPYRTHYTNSTWYNCCLKWYRNSTLYVMEGLFDIMWRSALRVPYTNATTPTTDLQTFTAHFTGTELRYKSNFRFLAAAIIIMLLGLFAIFVLLWGWWELGRPVTLSPLETAKAFGAPILLGAGHRKEVHGILEEMGDERVAHDGDEMIWNGVMNASARWEMGQVPSARVQGEMKTRDQLDMGTGLGPGLGIMRMISAGEVTEVEEAARGEEAGS